MQSVKVQRSGISADQAAEVLRLGLGGEYLVQADGDTQLRVSKGMARATVSLRDGPDGTAFDVSGEAGVSVMPLAGFITKMMNERGLARRTAAVIGQAEAFRGMNALDYILDAVLVATIFLQFRGRRLTIRNLGLPIAIVVYFLIAYLKGVPTAGNDLYLIGGGVALGLIFGVGAGAFTRVYPGEKGIYAKAGLLAAAFWATGVVLRTAFSLYASDGGASADRNIGRVMHSWDITSSNAIVACLLLMVLVEVGSRQFIVGARYFSLRKRTATSPSGSRPLTAFGDAVVPNPGQD